MTNEQPEPLRLADLLEPCCLTIGDAQQAVAAAMLRKLYVHNTELENSLIKKSIAIQKIWKERDDLRKRQVADEALLRHALHALQLIDDAMPFPVAKQTIASIKERLK